MIIIFDIDGTLADIDHRLHWIRSGPKNWKAFYTAMADDTPIESICSLARSSYEIGHVVILCTGRNEDHRAGTEHWLSRHKIRYDALYMRGERDHRPDFEVKEDALKKIIDRFGKPDLVFEDRQQVVDMWRRNGIRCLQVAEGQY